MFNTIRRWLNGSFTCIRCGSELNTMSFGYGTAICPSCYMSEKHFLSLDKGYWLNRILLRINLREYQQQLDEYDEIMLHETMVEHEIYSSSSGGLNVSSRSL